MSGLLKDYAWKLSGSIARRIGASQNHTLTLTHGHWQNVKSSLKLGGKVLQQQRCIMSQCDKHVVESKYSDELIPSENLAQFVMKNWSKYGQKLAVKCSDTGTSFTYDQLTDAVHSLASSLKHMGIKEGDVVFLLSPNCPEYPIIYLASTLVGAIVTTNNPAYTAGEVSHALSLSGCKLIFTSPEFLTTVQTALTSLQENNRVKETVVIGKAEGYRSLSSLLSNEFAGGESPEVNYEEHLAALPFSSGTTGLPKGVMLSHSNIVSNIIQLRNCGMSVTYDDMLGGVLPFFHIYGQVATLLLGLTAGSSIATMRKFDFPKFLQLIQSERVTLCHLVPPIILALTKSELTYQYDISSLSLITSGAAPLKQQLSSEFVQKMKNVELLQGYGLTETSPVVNFCEPGAGNKHGSIGLLLPNVKAKVVDLETHESLPSHQEGELYYHGPNIMKGYWQNSQATEDCLDGSWFRTGDIGYYDDEGYFYVVDRLKELIKYKGFQVAPAELEALLLTHPKILDAAVVSIPSDEAGELPRAYVVVKPDQTATDDEIHNFMKENVANHKQLRGGIRKVPEIPKSASGKILRRVLKEEALKDL